MRSKHSDTNARYLSGLSSELNPGWGLFSILQNGMLSESKLAAWLAAIIAEIAFYQWNLQYKILIAVSCSDCSPT